MTNATHPALPEAQTPPKSTTIGLARADASLELAIQGAGGVVSALRNNLQAMIWNRHHDVDALRSAVNSMPQLEWVQLPSAGVDDFFHAGLLRSEIVWTSAKGAYARPVAEHALALTLSALRLLPRRARARSWGEQAGRSLHGLNVLVIGGGGVASEILRLLSVFDANTVIIRRTADPVSGANRTRTFGALHEELGSANVIIVAAALTKETKSMFDATAFAAMRPDAVFVNVARGSLVDTSALVTALDEGRLGGVALDVTEPEPLPHGHPLWSYERVLITPHSADTAEMIAPLLARRVNNNVTNWLAGLPLIGQVDTRAGY
jgi:phosphoglycerate dehydrogenase-like enzyme